MCMFMSQIEHPYSSSSFDMVFPLEKKFSLRYERDMGLNLGLGVFLFLFSCQGLGMGKWMDIYGAFVSFFRFFQLHGYEKRGRGWKDENAYLSIVGGGLEYSRIESACG
jgi:hypothetical protein